LGEKFCFSLKDEKFSKILKEIKGFTFFLSLSSSSFYKFSFKLREKKKRKKQRERKKENRVFLVLLSNPLSADNDLKATKKLW
jgi:hypothetical protein